jgi:hypothetical protein
MGIIDFGRIFIGVTRRHRKSSGPKGIGVHRMKSLTRAAVSTSGPKNSDGCGHLRLLLSLVLRREGHARLMLSADPTTEMNFFIKGMY